jgi:hypothetical protein
MSIPDPPEHMVNPVPIDASHTSAADVSAYLDRTLSEGDRERVEAHLADCNECRQEVVDLYRLIRSHSPQRHVVRWVIAAGVAATLAITLALPRGPERGPLGNPTEQIERGAPAEESSRLSAWAPAGPSPVDRDSLTISWGAAQGSGVQYRVTLSDADGRVLWTASTSDTILRPPPSLTLPGGRTYYWYTDALLPDGRSLTTGVQEFRMAP